MEKKVLLLITACALLGLASCNHSTPAASSSAVDSSTPASSAPTSSAPVSSSSVDTTVYATGLTVDSEAVTLKIEGTHQIVATVAPTNVTTAGVTYASSDSTVASVSEAGLITAVKVGTANITVSTKSLNGAAGAVITKTVAVTVTLKSISDINAAAAWDVKGVVSALTTKGFVLSDATASVLVYLNAAPTYTIGDVVEVSGDATSDNGFFQFGDTAIIKKLTETAPTIPDAVALTTDVADSWATATSFAQTAFKKYKWTTYAKASGNFTTINLDGSATVIENMYTPTELKVTAGNKYEIEGYFDGYSSKSKFANIALTKVTQVWDDPTSIAITASAETVVAEETITLTAAVTPSTAKQDVTWSLANKDSTITATLATISDTGVLSGVAAGVVTVTATSKALTSVTATKDITVEAAKPLPTSMTATIANSLIAIGKTSQITTVFDPVNAKNGLTYVSSDETVAKVDASGVVTGVAAGKATITVTSTAVSTLTQTIDVEVAEAKTCPAANVGIKLSTTTETTLTGVYALTSYNTRVRGFLGATSEGVLYIYDSNSTIYSQSVEAGKYYDLIGVGAFYHGTYEFKPQSSDTTKSPVVENTTCTHYAWSFESSMTLDFADTAAVTTALQGLVGKTDAEVAAYMTFVTFKNVYIPALGSSYSYLQATAGTDFSCPTALENSHTIKMGVYSLSMPSGWTAADQLVDYQGFFYATNNAFSAGASAADILCRLAGGTITSVK